MARLAGSRRFRRGLSTVEAALVFPILLVVTMGIIEYGWMFLKSQQITNATRQGARIAARPDATLAEVDAAIAAAMLAAGLDGSGYSVVESVPADIAGLSAGSTLTITVTVTYGNISLGMPLVPTPNDLDASFTMAKEGP